MLIQNYEYVCMYLYVKINVVVNYMVGAPCNANVYELGRHNYNRQALPVCQDQHSNYYNSG